MKKHKIKYSYSHSLTINLMPCPELGDDDDGDDDGNQDDEEGEIQTDP